MTIGTRPPSTDSSIIELPHEARSWLLGWARRCIATFLDEGELLEPSDLPAEVQEACGCFVSLHTKVGALRGCIGTFEADAPLWRQVRQMGIAAATRDPRFTSLRPQELIGCEIEISVLSQRIPATPDQIVVGRHGIWVESGLSRGVLLPQVATQRGWDAEMFISQTCIKAGLPEDAWRHGRVNLSVFSALVFSD